MKNCAQLQKWIFYLFIQNPKCASHSKWCHQMLQNDVIKCCKMMSPHSNEPATWRNCVSRRHFLFWDLRALNYEGSGLRKSRIQSTFQSCKNMCVGGRGVGGKGWSVRRHRSTLWFGSDTEIDVNLAGFTKKAELLDVKNRSTRKKSNT